MLPRIADSRRHGATALGGCLAALLLCAMGCRTESSPHETTSPAVTRTARSGNVTLTLTVRPSELDFSEQAEVLIQASAPPGVTVTLEDYEVALQEADLAFELRILSEAATNDETAAKQAGVQSRRYRLAFTLPGEYDLPPARATFPAPAGAVDGDATDTEASHDGAIQELETERVTVTARDPNSRELSDEELASIRTLDPIELPTAWDRWWWLLPAGIVALVVLVLFVAPRLRRALLRRLARRERPAPPPIPAHEWARMQLAELIAEHLIDKGRIQDFHYRLSAIVRGYIERRYGVTAAEMTTEEFLTAAIADSRFGGDITHELERFLAVCDLVKYARHQASETESGTALATAEALVDRTQAEPHGAADGAPNRGEEV